jgi:2,3,4,5-tetrahydropyridine-2-carboxylate N-succinyltransferase
MTLTETITRLFEQGSNAARDEARDAFLHLRAELSLGHVRSAEPDRSSPTGWRVNVWVKQGILLGFRFGDVVDMGVAKGRWQFYDKDTLPMKRIDPASGVRVVPGGSSIREGAYLAPGVICMPPMYINVGAYVDEGTLVDSHALVGSCAQIGRKVHLSAAAQIGGVLEPVMIVPEASTARVLITAPS